MENTSLTSFAWENVTSSLESENAANYLTNIRDQVLKVIYIIIGTVGVVDNLFVLVIFFLFVKITDKVCKYLHNLHSLYVTFYPSNTH